MSKITALTLLSTAIAIAVGIVTSPTTQAQTPPRRTAQLFYPPASEKNTVMVIGQGTVKVPADTAQIEFLFATTDKEELEPPPIKDQELQDASAPRLLLMAEKKPPAHLLPLPAEPEPLPPANSKPTLESKPLTKASLQSVVNSLTAIGVRADNIKVEINTKLDSDNAKILVSLEKPTRDRVQEIVTTAKKSANNLDDIVLQDVGVEYAVNDCQGLQSSAYQSAAKDAQNRATALASAMGMRLGTPSVAEPFFTMFYPTCNSKPAVSWPTFGVLSTPSYNPSASAEIEMRKDIFVTYTVNR